MKRKRLTFDVLMVMGSTPVALVGENGSLGSSGGHGGRYGGLAK